MSWEVLKVTAESQYVNLEAAKCGCSCSCDCQGHLIDHFAAKAARKTGYTAAEKFDPAQSRLLN